MRIVTLDEAKGFDTVTPITARSAADLYAADFRFAGRYVTSLSNDEVKAILGSGLALTLFTYANSFDPSDEIAALKRLSIPPEVTVILDVESVTDDAITLQARINTWARALKAASYIPGMYVGVNSKLTSAELYNLAVVRYMKSASRIVDRNGDLAEPKCGWCATQTDVDVVRAGVTVDVDFSYADYNGRRIAMVAA
jgi:hypothetical protein